MHKKGSLEQSSSSNLVHEVVQHAIAGSSTQNMFQTPACLPRFLKALRCDGHIVLSSYPHSTFSASKRRSVDTSLFLAWNSACFMRSRLRTLWHFIRRACHFCQRKLAKNWSYSRKALKNIGRDYWHSNCFFRKPTWWQVLKNRLR